tara:strand:+ start:703 stop:1242 length:540 start_codon:yes stop_codon:yes gene_type:complete
MFPFSSRARQRKAFGEALYQACVTHARTPELYRELNVPDTPEGRFEMISLHMAILIERLNQEGEVGRAAAQEAFDAMFRDFDGALREMAVGDLSVSKKIKALAKAFYARLDAYLPAMERGDEAGFSKVIGDQIEADPPVLTQRLASYALDQKTRLAAQEGAALLAGTAPVFATGMRASA